MSLTIFETMGGQRACLALARAWHERVMSDPVVSHAFHAGVHEHHSERLAAYFGEQLGGPAAYTDGIADYSSVVRTHSGNGPHEQMDGRAVACFVRALDDASIPNDPELRSALVAWFTWGTAMLNHRWASPRDVPDDLPFPSGAGTAQPRGTEAPASLSRETLRAWQGDTDAYVNSSARADPERRVGRQLF